MDIRGRRAIVTGAATGVGRGIAEHFARVGARVLLCDVDAEAGQAVADSLTREGLEAAFVRADVGSPGDAEELVGEAVSRWGGLDILVNNAGVQVENTIEDLDPAEWDRLMDVNFKGVFLCSKYAIPAMREGGGGAIVNIASVNGFWVEPALAAYAAAKGGVINLTRAIALENGRYQIRCNCICPGYIDTGMAQRYFEVQDDPDAAREAAGKMHALGRVGRPEEVAAMALFLCSDDASFCTAQPFIVDGGLSGGVATPVDF
jgi:NAD(P)-dependent dehydrogenase (short-subunit alcohol dehydrogenase family)